MQASVRRSVRVGIYLMILTTGALLGVVVGSVPAVRGRIAALGAPGTTPAAVAALPGASAPVSRGGRAVVQDPGARARPAVREGGAGAPASTAEAQGQAHLRSRREPLASSAGDLLAQERLLAGRQAGRPVGVTSWKQQAAISLATMLLALGLVWGALRLGLGRSLWGGRLRSEELRLHHLQNSIVDALEELQAAVANAGALVPRAAPEEAEPVAPSSPTPLEVLASARISQPLPARRAARRGRSESIPHWMGQVEYLAAEGLNASEIAQQLHITRERVFLALAYQRQGRATAEGADAPAIPAEGIREARAPRFPAGRVQGRGEA